MFHTYNPFQGFAVRDGLTFSVFDELLFPENIMDGQPLLMQRQGIDGERNQQDITSSRHLTPEQNLDG